MKTRRRRLEKSDISLNDCVRVVLDNIAAPQAHDKTAICTIVNTARRRRRKMNDSKWDLGEKYNIVKQRAAGAEKIGFLVEI